MDKKKQKAISYIIWLKGFITGKGQKWEDRTGRKKQNKSTSKKKSAKRKNFKRK